MQVSDGALQRHLMQKVDTVDLQRQFDIRLCIDQLRRLIGEPQTQKGFRIGTRQQLKCMIIGILDTHGGYPLCTNTKNQVNYSIDWSLAHVKFVWTYTVTSG